MLSSKQTGLSQPLGTVTETASLQTWVLDLDMLLARVERSATHYQLLGLERAASREDVLQAYQQVILQLFPAYQISGALTPEIEARLDAAFARVSEAVAVLANFRRRNQYDSSIAPAPSVMVDSPKASVPMAAVAVARETATLVARQVKRSEVYAIHKVDESERRRCERFKMKLPVRITGYDRQSGKWQEMGETLNVSRTGVSIELTRRMGHHTILYLVLPLPPKLREHGFTEASYNVYGIVRRIYPRREGKYTIGIEFIGEHPPAGYLDKPWAACRTRQWGGFNRRRQPRYERVEQVQLEFLSADHRVLGRETGVTESISEQGARIRVPALPAGFDLLRVIIPHRSFDSLAILTNRYLGPDNLPRLCLQYVEG